MAMSSNAISTASLQPFTPLQACGGRFMPPTTTITAPRNISPERACEPVAKRGSSLRRRAGEPDPLRGKHAAQPCAYTTTLNGAGHEVPQGDEASREEYEEEQGEWWGLGRA